MKEVFIEVENRQLAELGVDQPISYKPLRFKESAFIGYWISEIKETGRPYIIAYIGTQTFCCKCSQRNIELFESILNNNKP